MRLLVVDPPHEIFKFFRGRMPHPGLTQLAAYVERELPQIELEIMDCTVCDNTWQDLEAKIRDWQPHIVAVSAMSTCYVYDAMDVAWLVKQINPRIITVGGGVHFSSVPRESLSLCPSMDFLVMGEGEITLVELLKALLGGAVNFDHLQGLAWRNQGEIIINEPRPLVEDIDIFPLPAYHKFPMDKYFMPSLGMSTHGSLIITTARGCGGDCTFCSETTLWRNLWRPHSAARTADIMQLLYEKYGKICFMFGDNSFNWRRQRVQEFAQEMEQRKLPVNFWFQSRPEHIVRDADILPWLKKLGLYMISMGVETPSQTALDNYNKRQTTEISQRAMQIIKQNGLLLITNIMFGDEDDTEETLEATIEFAKPYSDHFAVCMTTPLPGTLYYERAKEQGRILEWDYSKYDMLHPIMTTKTLSLERIAWIHPRAMRRFYTRFRVFWDAFFSLNKFLRRNNQFFVKVALQMAYEEVFKRPWWIQKGYEPFVKFMERKNGHPFARIHGPQAPAQAPEPAAVGEEKGNKRHSWAKW